MKVEGKPLFEYRVTRLRLGERLCDITSTFSTQPNQRFRNRKAGVKLPYEVAIGLNTQDKGASMTLDGEKGIIAVYEPLAGKGLGTGVLVDPATVVRTTRLPATDKHGKNEQALVIVRPDEHGTRFLPLRLRLGGRRRHHHRGRVVAISRIQSRPLSPV